MIDGTIINILDLQFWDYIPDVAYTFFLALLLALTVEGPFRRIEKRFIMKRVEKVAPINNK